MRGTLKVMLEEMRSAQEMIDVEPDLMKVIFNYIISIENKICLNVSSVILLTPDSVHNWRSREKMGEPTLWR